MGNNMKKSIFVICIIMALIFNTCLAFAADFEEPIEEENISEYVDTNSADSYLSISGSRATCTTTVITRSSSMVNKMVVTVYYYKSSGTYIGSNTVTVNNSGTYFSGSTSKTLSSHGAYYAEAYVKLYHNSQLIESFTLVTGNATY